MIHRIDNLQHIKYIKCQIDYFDQFKLINIDEIFHLTKIKINLIKTQKLSN